MLTSCYIMVYDYETIGSDPYTTEPCEIAARIIDPKTLKVVDGATFETKQKIKPTDFSLIQEKALQINGTTRAQLEEAPDLEPTFKDFVKFTKKFSAQGKAPWSNVIPAGHNIINFDNIITKRLCDKYKQGNIFHPTVFIDTLNLHFLWFFQQDEPAKYSMDYLRPWYGMSSEKAHTALADVDNCCALIIRFLEFHKRIMEKNKPKFKGSFVNG